MTADDIITDILRREGSAYTNDPADHGGPTKYGITLRDLRSWRLNLALTADDVEALTEDEARAIYRKRYIADPGLEQIPDEWLRAFLVDAGVLQGPKNAIKFLQRSLGVATDGVLGPVTLAALAESDTQRTRKAVMRERIQHLVAAALVDLPPDLVQSTNLKFLRGWLNRVVSFL
jgi:lysozyme family protein